MSLRRKLLLAIASIVVLLLLFITFILPVIIKTKAIEGIATATGRQAAIDRVTINPFTLRAQVRGFRLAEADGKATFASFSSLSVRLSTASLPRRALVVGDMTLDRPQVALVRKSENSYNFSDIIERSQKRPKSEGETLFSLNNIRVVGGSIDFDDRASRQPARHTVRDLNLAIPFISNIPYMAERYVTPHFGAVINGATLKVDGRLKPLAKSAETTLTLKLEQLDLPHYLAYLPFEPGFRAKSGTLSTDLELAYRVGIAEKPELNITGTLNLAKLDMLTRKGDPLAALGRATASINRLGVFKREADLGQVTMDRADLHLDRDRQGTWNFQQLLPKTAEKPAGEKPAKEEKGPPAPKPAVRVASFTITHGTLHYRDRLPQGGFSTTASSIALTVKEFSTAANHLAKLNLALSTVAGEELTVAGSLGVTPMTAKADLKLTGVRLERYHPYLADLLAAPVRGQASLEGTLTYTGEEGLKLDGSSLTIANLLVPFGATDQLSLKTLAVTGVSLDLKGRQANVANVGLQRGSISLTREANGSVSPQQLVKKPARPAPAAATPPPPFRYAVQNISLKGIDASFTDKGRPGPPTLLLKGISASLRNVTGPKFAPIRFGLAAGFGSGSATLAANGTLVPEPFRLNGQVTLNRLPLRDFDAYYPDDMGVFIAGGTVDTKINLDLAKKGDRIGGSYNGSLGVRSFYSLDTLESEDLLKWESLQIDDIRGTLEPFSLLIKDVALTSPFARVIINKDGTLNLQHLGKAQAKATAAPAPRPPAIASAAAPPPAAPAGPSPVAINNITVQDGTLAFTDRKLPGGFASTFYNLGGRVSGLSSETSRFATVDLRGVLENQSPLKISGILNPLRGDLLLDLAIAFTDIELSPVTPYSGTYLGYTIDKGKLFLDLKYKIENKALSAENRVFIDQFTFGRKVESDKATSLPVKLAIALLKDGKGEIHLDLPVSGRTDDPKFSVWKIVFQMLKNLLVKAATSPFSLLSSMFGGSEDFSAVAFAPGTSVLRPSEQEKLTKLAKALAERPGISLEIGGYVDQEQDPDGYRQELLSHRIRNEKFLALVKAKQNRPEDTPETVAVSAEEYPVYLKVVYRKEDFAKPRNAIGLVKDLPDGEMKKLLLAHLQAGEAELQGLAQERAAVVQAFLRDRGGIPRERLFLKQADIYRKPDRTELGAARVEFGVTVK